MVSWGRIKPNPAVGIDNNLDEEGGVKKEKVEEVPIFDAATALFPGVPTRRW